MHLIMELGQAAQQPVEGAHTPLVAGGHLQFEFLPSIDADNVVANVEMPQGTPAPVTLAVADYVREAGARGRGG